MPPSRFRTLLSFGALVVCAAAPLSCASASYYQKAHSDCLSNPLDVEACGGALEADERQLTRAQRKQLEERLSENDALICGGTDAEVAVLIRKLTSEAAAQMTTPEYVAYARSRSCLVLGASALGFNVTIPGRAALRNLTEASEAERKRGLALIEKSCSMAERVPHTADVPGQVKYMRYRVPVVLACSLLGDAYALGLVEYDLKKATRAFRAGCNVQPSVRWEESFGSCELPPCSQEFRDSQEKYFMLEQEPVSRACDAAQAAEKADDCQEPESASCKRWPYEHDKPSVPPLPAYLVDESWQAIGRVRVEAAERAAIGRRRDAETQARNVAYEQFLEQFPAKAAKASPSEQMALVVQALEQAGASEESNAARVVPLIRPIVLGALGQIAKQKTYVAVGHSSLRVLDKAQVSEARWAELRAALLRFRLEAGTHYAAKAERAKGRTAAFAAYHALAVQFGANASAAAGAKQRFAEATLVSVELPPVQGACAFLARNGVRSGAKGQQARVAIAVEACQEKERTFSSNDPYTYEVEEDYASGTRKERVTRTRRVPNCHTVYTQSCTGKEDYSCYTSGSREECSGTKEETTEEEVEVPVTGKRKVTRTGHRDTEHHERVLDVSARLTATLAHRSLSAPFRFSQKLEGAASYAALEAQAAEALAAALSTGFVQGFIGLLAQEALATAAKATSGGDTDDAENAYLTALALGSAFTPEMAAWFVSSWGVGEGGVRDVLTRAR